MFAGVKECNTLWAQALSPSQSILRLISRVSSSFGQPLEVHSPRTPTDIIPILALLYGTGKEQ